MAGDWDMVLFHSRNLILIPLPFHDADATSLRNFISYIVYSNIIIDIMHCCFYVAVWYEKLDDTDIWLKLFNTNETDNFELKLVPQYLIGR